MLAATERLNKTSERLQQGRQQLLETEVGAALLPGHVTCSASHPHHSCITSAPCSCCAGVCGDGACVLVVQASGAAVLAELHSQRQVLEHARSTQQGTSAGLTQAEATLKTMAARAKMFFWG